MTRTALIFLTFMLNISLLVAQQTYTFKLFYYSDCSIAPTNEKERLKEELKILDNAEISKIQIRGFCDDVGTSEDSDLLSLKRAKGVAYLLSKLKIVCDAAPILEGRGEIQLDNSSELSIEEQRANNRRVEIEIDYTIIEKPKTVQVELKKESIISNDVEVGDKITLPNILFHGGHNEFLSVSYETLELLVEELESNPEYHIRILGHVCCTPSRETSEDGMDLETGKKNLSMARAKAVYKYLIKNGIERDRLSYKGLKGNFPLGGPSWLDRRVEIEITQVGDIN